MLKYVDIREVLKQLKNVNVFVKSFPNAMVSRILLLIFSGTNVLHVWYKQSGH